MNLDSKSPDHVGRRVALVTGAAQGIGRAIAARLLCDGFIVVVADLRNAQKAAEALGPDAWGIDLDVSDASQVQRMIEQVVERHGRLDALVNNAGIYTSLKKKPFDQIPLEEWRRVFEVNVEGVWHCCRFAAVPMKAAGVGAIVNISSASVSKGNAGLLQYVASKGAVQAMTRVLARELGEFGVRVNTVSPGFTLSDGVMQDADAGREQQRLQVRDARAIRADVEPADIAAAVAYLAREDGRLVTGQNLTVDGGMVMN
ncbi:SDR family NAD(P)-dependent oxidoreductase [Bordetella genomosp. 12]|uniref:Ketoreductase domain-containing protein n=1 Tax=Bordetella genomosp. 12 TaxID=463035 RepID=A0A261VC29_9BORD|nr:SDR family oxidoreductase [Bordetella genomosp. 12]OZI71565.1 hypothetical protein CAL22_17290 [Bordetella genomosp. 12]